ncbi:hypothetical protein HBI56_126670 [Parastagonospora nodorum]|nr:hypothetical protein HBI10_145750 [Parastagonospora nodorum]KAH4019865.1 hypothetical protein HBI13_118900 [Parastagonospora nodorum]KAH4076925.1 hypothetical protein HBH50_012410 [Parastagonospora nodorum]KAH4095595.1 hypothetical protein HBH48_045390 [Parastagonospora nodorum]KAH4118606.1 hypothetical protein HBH47_135680 [Parastagonospora nodorum]
MTEYDDYGIPVGAFVEPEDFRGQAWRTARAFYLYRVRPLAWQSYTAVRRADWSFRRWFTLANALVVLWWVVLYWGETGTFDGSIKSCSWDRWENWEAGANPHRLIFVADPQLIDPHTYPGRPWPLNPLAYKYTDLYLRRTYSRLQTVLYPDTIFFLGDLFDGGREWSTRTTRSPEERYRRYDDNYWINEYRRFGNIFFKHWGDAGMEPRPGQPGRKLISSLPGNHDLGFARGVQVGVRNRFNAYFGDGNRIDVIANHTFVSIDSLSLSAFGQDSPAQVEELWRPTTDFLEKAKTQKKRLVQRELRRQQGLRPYPGFAHYDIKTEDLAKAQLPHSQDDVTEFPTILLTHIPLFRAPGTPCGPLRERFPPTPPPAGQPPLEKDDRNAISVSGGYQYQNVLNKEITVDVANKIGDIRYAFSGDDHDYCEVLHRSYASGGGGIREITVKSTSWAMGVRRPGVVLVSLWNPVDASGKPRSGSADATIQTKLCLFPDQIGTFIRYGMLFGLTFFLLAIRAALVTTGVLKPYTSPPQPNILPTTAQDIKAQQKFEDNPAIEDELSHSSNSSTSSQHKHLLARAKPAKYTYPLIQHAGSYSPPDEEKRREFKIYGSSSSSSTKKAEKKKGLGLWMYEMKWTLGKVLVVGGVWYVWLVWGDRR